MFFFKGLASVFAHYPGTTEIGVGGVGWVCVCGGWGWMGVWVGLDGYQYLESDKIDL